MPKMFSPSKMFLKKIFCPWKHEKTGLKSCQTGPNPAQISILVPKKSPTAGLLYNDFGYRNELDVKKQIFEESTDHQDYYIANEAILSDLENDYLDEKKNIDFTDQPPKKKRKKYKVKKEGENNSATKTTSGTKLKKDFGIDDVSLFPYLKYDNETDMFECSICSKSTKVRNNLLRHIKVRNIWFLSFCPNKRFLSFLSLYIICMIKCTIMFCLT